MEILAGAAQALGRGSQQSLRFQSFSHEGGALTLQSGLTILTEPFEALTDPDLLIIPAIWRQPQRVLQKHPRHIDVITQHLSRRGLTVSIGSGSFLLAATGQMNGRSATTHWHWFDHFKKRYPLVHLEREQLITQSDQVFCVSSVNSVADLMVYLCSQIFSPRVARHIENQFSPEIRQRFSPSPLGAPRDLHGDELIVDAQIDIAKDLRSVTHLKELADKLGVSARTLARRFTAATGVSMTEYRQQRRLDEAQALLRRTNLSIMEIGHAVGLSDASHFARMFREQTGLTPSGYRIAVREKAFAPHPASD